MKIRPWGSFLIGAAICGIGNVVSPRNKDFYEVLAYSAVPLLTQLDCDSSSDSFPERVSNGAAAYAGGLTGEVLTGLARMHFGF